MKASPSTAMWPPGPFLQEILSFSPVSTSPGLHDILPFRPTSSHTNDQRIRRMEPIHPIWAYVQNPDPSAIPGPRQAGQSPDLLHQLFAGSHCTPAKPKCRLGRAAMVMFKNRMVTLPIIYSSHEDMHEKGLPALVLVFLLMTITALLHNTIATCNDLYHVCHHQGTLPLGDTHVPSSSYLRSTLSSDVLGI